MQKGIEESAGTLEYAINKSVKQRRARAALPRCTFV